MPTRNISASFKHKILRFSDTSRWHVANILRHLVLFPVRDFIEGAPYDL